MSPDLWSLYTLMLKSRLFEEAVTLLRRNLLVRFGPNRVMGTPISEGTFLGAGGRHTVRYDVPAEGAHGPVPQKWEPVPIGKAVLRRAGDDVTLVSVGVGVHRPLEAADTLKKDGISTGVIDLRTISPLDKVTLCEVVAQTGRLLVVDEDYESFGLSGELAAVVLEAGIPVKYARVCTQVSIPYARHLEDQTLPNVERIRAGVKQLL